MNFNTFLLRLGLDPDNFKNIPSDPIKTDKGFIYEIEQRTDQRECPHCHADKVYINDYAFVEIGCSENNEIQDTIRIKKVRYKCRSCHKTFTPEIKGINRYDKNTEQIKQLIYSDFARKLTFQDIANKYHLSNGRIVQLFDEKVKFVPRLKMPRVLCIDEIRFSEEINQKFVCVLTNFEKGEIIDIIKNRQMAYLREYFGSINLNELNIVKVFISDMYDAYESVRSRYFPNAIHIVDLFHVITQLTNAVNRLRTKVMNTKAKKGSLAYNFMKAHWKYFLCRSSKVPDKFYTYTKTGEVLHYDDLILECLKLDLDLWSGYAILQELFSYANHYYSFEEAVNFINRIVSRLHATTSDILKTVAKTYHRWRNEIANGLAKSQRQMKYTNAIAESLNNQLKTIIKSAYGYHNFERFRKRAMLIMTYGKKPI